ncbi:hypothetical protein [Citrobacter meridianamericanus]|uniref:hypothetical protein n=1 Tax=Citrobacter meridianamericanus TaxID=2894201 RepID=UPI0012499D49
MERNEVIEWAKQSISAEEWPMHKGHHFNIDEGTWSGDFPELPAGLYWDKAPAFEDFQICKKGSNPSSSDYFWPIGLTTIHQ